MSDENKKKNSSLVYASKEETLVSRSSAMMKRGLATLAQIETSEIGSNGIDLLIILPGEVETSDMRKISHRDTGELATHARYTVTDSLFKFDNLEAYGLGVQIIEEGLNTGLSFLGIALQPEQVGAVSKASKAFVEEVEFENYTEIEKEGFRRFVRDFTSAARCSKEMYGRSVVQFALTDSAVGEVLAYSTRIYTMADEDVRKSQSPEFFDKTIANPLFENSNNFKKLYWDRPIAIQAISFTDKILVGCFKELEIDPVESQAEIIEFVVAWMEDYTEVNGKPDTNHQKIVDYSLLAKINSTSEYFIRVASEIIANRQQQQAEMLRKRKISVLEVSQSDQSEIEKREAIWELINSRLDVTKKETKERK
jgi:hypothetical protein